MSNHSARGAAWEATRKQVFARDNGVCGYCGREAKEVDHIVPRSKGGTDTMDNLIASCGDCNRSKGDRLESRNNWFNRSWLTSL